MAFNMLSPLAALMPMSSPCLAAPKKRLNGRMIETFARRNRCGNMQRCNMTWKTRERKKTELKIAAETLDRRLHASQAGLARHREARQSERERER